MSGVSQSRLTTRSITVTATLPGTYNWVCPAGVTFIMLSVLGTAVLPDLSMMFFDVVPGTTYTFTMRARTAAAQGVYNDFGSLGTFVFGSILVIEWVE